MSCDKGCPSGPRGTRGVSGGTPDAAEYLGTAVENYVNGHGSWPLNKNEFVLLFNARRLQEWAALFDGITGTGSADQVKVDAAQRRKEAELIAAPYIEYTDVTELADHIEVLMSTYEGYGRDAAAAMEMEKR